MRRRVVISALCMLSTLLLTACDTTPPVPRDGPLLRLPPAALGRTLELQQRLRAQFQNRPPAELLLMFQANPRTVRVAVLHGGQTVARLEWDGRDLTEEHAFGWPDVVDAERVLSDLQLAWWPADAVRAALPPGWRLDEAPGIRRLLRGDEVVVTIRSSAQRIELEQHRVGYRLQIDTLNPETP